MPATCNAATSPRLKRILAVLADGQEHSTRDIVLAANVVAVDTAIRELRGYPNNLPIRRRQAGSVHYYLLEPLARLQTLVQQASAWGEQP